MSVGQRQSSADAQLLSNDFNFAEVLESFDLNGLLS